ncbi:MAG TPA: sugar phosphate nucleotidyltransferase, partial [Actinoplanes sp.]|nr:sugar phosphate nucleotidyltransferase [Actinoplanes sp.]
IVLSFMEVAPDETSRYGIASVSPSTFGGDVVEVTGLVEKPAPEHAPSNLAVLGRYILPATIFEAIENTKPGSGGEIQLTDAMAVLLAAGTPVHGIVYRGQRYDTGMPLGYLQTVVQLACRRDDVGPEFKQWLGEFVGGSSQ